MIEKNFKVVVCKVPKDYNPEINYNDYYYFDDIQDALAKYDYEMKNVDHDYCQYFKIVVLNKYDLDDDFGYNELLAFECYIEDLDVLLKSS